MEIRDFDGIVAEKEEPQKSLEPNAQLYENWDIWED